MAEILRNDFKPFAVNADAQVMSQYQWDEGTLRRNGHVPGLANQYLTNKVERQTSLFASALAIFITRAGLNAIDDEDDVQLANAFQAAVTYFVEKTLYSELDKTATGDESVLIGYNHITKTLFGYPLDSLVTLTPHILGGNPAMEAEDYPDGILSGGDPTMETDDYADGTVSGGTPYTY